MKNNFLVVLCTTILSLYSCTKDDTIVIESKQDFLINKRWQLTGMTVKTATGVPSNEYDSLPSYRKDDYFLFKHDSTYEFNDHIDTVPGKHSRILDAGTWKLDKTQTHLDMQSDVFNTTYTRAKIIEISSSKLSIERIHPGDRSITTTTYKSF